MKQKIPKTLKGGTSMALDKHRRIVREMPVHIEKGCRIACRILQPGMRFWPRQKPTMQGLKEIESRLICIICLLDYSPWLLDIT